MKAIAVATGVVLALGLSGCANFANLASDYKKSQGIVEGEGTQQDSFSLEVGQCLNDASASELDPDVGVSSVPVVDCSEAHDDEVYANVTAVETAFPGDDAVSDEAQKLCEAEFADYVGADYEHATSVDFSFYAPTAESWSTGDRAITCVVFGLDANGDLQRTVGSLKGSKGEITAAPVGA